MVARDEIRNWKKILSVGGESSDSVDWKEVAQRLIDFVEAVDYSKLQSVHRLQNRIRAQRERIHELEDACVDYRCSYWTMLHYYRRREHEFGKLLHEHGIDCSAARSCKIPEAYSGELEKVDWDSVSGTSSTHFVVIPEAFGWYWSPVRPRDQIPIPSKLFKTQEEAARDAQSHGFTKQVWGWWRV